MASIETSVVNPNILNLDLDPEFWQNLDPDPWLPVCYRFRKKLKIVS